MFLHIQDIVKRWYINIMSVPWHLTYSSGELVLRVQSAGSAVAVVLRQNLKEHKHTAITT